MNTHLKAVSRVSLITALVFVCINFVFFLIELYKIEQFNDWNFTFKHGSFYLNDLATGFPFGTSAGFLIVIVVFVSLLFREYQQGNIQLRAQKNRT